MIYKALALQVTCRAINQLKTKEEVKAHIQREIQRIGAQIKASISFIGKDVKLVVLPEYFLTGFPMGESIESWRYKACIDPDGEAYQQLGQLAQENSLYLCGNAYETDRHFPNLYFQCSFIIAPSGDVILRYRRLNSMFAPTPHDVWEKYLDIYGLENVFPVVKTDIGNLACIASEEILYPEIARCFAMRGAEIFLHNTSEIGSPMLTQKNVAKLARAIENMAYVVSANSAGIEGTPIPMASTDGGSKIINYNGLVLAEAGYGESMVANAEIDLHALRHFRRRPGMGNFLARQRFELYAQSYAEHSFYPPNTLLAQEPDRGHFMHMQALVIERLEKIGVL
ncbi:MAG: nitrilase-related carbon-nitrogen hydrolase [Cytophagales bacterium]|nr:nitrilase [Bernardetiaceae bacterium]MDW8210615.1 nitrilase-related carbon-nitrogen hydrolase [Cytophagales bacterium]